MPNFGKLFQITPSNQVLLTIRYDRRINKYIVTQFTIIETIEMLIDVEFDNEDDANIGFDKYDFEKATIFYNEMVKIIKNNNNGPMEII